GNNARHVGRRLHGRNAVQLRLDGSGAQLVGLQRVDTYGPKITDFLLAATRRAARLGGLHAGFAQARIHFLLHLDTDARVAFRSRNRVLAKARAATRFRLAQQATLCVGRLHHSSFPAAQYVASALASAQFCRGGLPHGRYLGSPVGHLSRPDAGWQSRVCPLP
nr:hypothetical protein [Tanacetum cinerariifolium]